jgi:hypothetical protein
MEGTSTGRAPLVITRDVEASAVADLALTPPRAALAATVDDEILLLPVSVTLEEPADPASSPRIVQVPEGNPDLAGRNVVVIADDGPQWFRLRSLTVRGMAKAMGDCTYRVVPKRIVAWDYGSLRPDFRSWWARESGNLWFDLRKRGMSGFGSCYYTTECS